MEIAVVVRPVVEDIGSFSLGSAIFEVTDVQRTIGFVHSSEAVGPQLVLP